MAAYEVLLLNTAIPQIQAAQSGDTYVVPRDIAFSAALTLSAGTANGVPYLNASKVLTTGSALTFDTARLSFIKASNGRVWSADGDDLFAIENSTSANADFRTSTTGATYLMFSDTDARARGYVAYLHNSDSMPFAVAGSEAMRLTSTGLGIGTSAPAEKLDVRSSSNAIGNFQSSSASGYAGINANNGSRNWYAGIRADASNGFGIRDETVGTIRLLIDSSGNLGIGTNNPAQKLTVNGDVSILGGKKLFFYNSTNTHTPAITSPSADVLAFLNNAGTQTMTLDASGNLLIGITSGTNVLTVVGASQMYHKYTGGTGSFQWGQYDTSGNVSLNNQANANMLFATNNTERARISATGEFQAVSAGGLGLGVGVTAGAGTTTATFVGRHSSTAGTLPSGTDSFIVWSNGNVVNTNGSYGTISDQKLKQDIVDAGSQWDDLKAIRFRKYRMKADVAANPDAPALLGVVAQELEQTSPGLVDESPDRDAEGNDLGTTTKSVKTSVLLMKAAVALQEAMARIEQLEAKVAAMGA